MIKIRFAHSLSSTEPAHLAAEFFAKNVAQRTNNRVQIQVFPSEQLGSGKEVNEMIRQGANVMNITDPGYMSDFVPDIGVLNGPYLIKDPADYQKLLASDWFKEIEKKLDAAGFKLIMSNGFFGQRHMIADKPIRKSGRHCRPHRARAAQPDVDRDLQVDGCPADDGAVVGDLQRVAAERGCRRRSAARFALGFQAA